MDSVDALVFSVGDQAYGIEVEDVVSVERISDIKKLDMLRDYVGLANLHEEVITTLDWRKILQKNISSEKNRTVIVVNTHQMKIGFVVDTVENLISVSSEDIYKISYGDLSSFIKGIIKSSDNMIALIDVESFLSNYGDIRSQIESVHTVSTVEKELC